MSDQLHAHEYTISGVPFVTTRPLPAAVQTYIAQWAHDPCWDIDDAGAIGDPAISKYAPELLAYAAAYVPAKDAEYEAKIDAVTDLRAIKIAFLRGDRDEALARAAIAKVEQLRRIADALDGFHQYGIATFKP
jgi:hypothetical protein